MKTGILLAGFRLVADEAMGTGKKLLGLFLGMMTVDGQSGGRIGIFLIRHELIKMLSYF